MSDWSGGYVADIEYTAAFNPDLSPHHLALACLLNGYEAPRLDRPFTYCELGCGQGLTLNLLAAIEPNGRFVGIDFNPAHIARAREFADAAGLDNVSFHEASFEELLSDGAPSRPEPCDFITLHGVYSWVSREARQSIVALLRRHLKPGGLAYVSYNAMPGWSNGLAVQRLLRDFADPWRGRSDQQLEHAAALLDALERAGAGALVKNPFVDQVRERLGKEETRYLVHEYLNWHWEPFYFADVARELGEAKLTFAASAHLLANFAHLELSAEQRQIVESVPPSLRETVKDVCVNASFRRDVYLRGPLKLTERERDERLRAVRLALKIPRRDIKLKLVVPAGEAALAPRTYEPVFDALAEAPRSIGELLALSALDRGGSSVSSAELAGILIGTQQVALAREPMESLTDRAGRFNRCIAEQVLRSDVYRKAVLASPLLATGVQYRDIEILTYLEAAAAPESDLGRIVERVGARLKASGRMLLKSGKEAGGDEAAWAAFRADLEKHLAANIPVWRLLQML